MNAVQELNKLGGAKVILRYGMSADGVTRLEMNSRSVLRMLRVLLKTIRGCRHNEIQSRVQGESKGLSEGIVFNLLANPDPVNLKDKKFDRR